MSIETRFLSFCYAVGVWAIPFIQAVGKVCVRHIVLGRRGQVEGSLLFWPWKYCLASSSIELHTNLDSASSYDLSFFTQSDPVHCRNEISS